MAVSDEPADELCSRWREPLRLYAEGELRDPLLVQLVRLHLRRCARCRRELERHDDLTLAILESCAADAAHDRPRRVETILARLGGSLQGSPAEVARSVDGRRWVRARRSRTALTWLAAAAALAIAVGLWLGRWREPETMGEPAPATLGAGAATIAGPTAGTTAGTTAGAVRTLPVAVAQGRQPPDDAGVGELRWVLVAPDADDPSRLPARPPSRLARRPQLLYGARFAVEENQATLDDLRADRVEWVVEVQFDESVTRSVTARRSAEYLLVPAATSEFFSQVRWFRPRAAAREPVLATSSGSRQFPLYRVYVWPDGQGNVAEWGAVAFEAGWGEGAWREASWQRGAEWRPTARLRAPAERRVRALRPGTLPWH